MTWTPFEVFLIVFVWFPLALPLVFSIYLLTIFCIMGLASGSFAIVQGTTPTARVWFGLLTDGLLAALIGGLLTLWLSAA